MPFSQAEPSLKDGKVVPAVSCRKQVRTCSTQSVTFDRTAFLRAGRGRGAFPAAGATLGPPFLIAKSGVPGFRAIPLTVARLGSPPSTTKAGAGCSGYANETASSCSRGPRERSCPGSGSFQAAAASGASSSTSFRLLKLYPAKSLRWRGLTQHVYSQRHVAQAELYLAAIFRLSNCPTQAL